MSSTSEPDYIIIANILGHNPPTIIYTLSTLEDLHKDFQVEDSSHPQLSYSQSPSLKEGSLLDDETLVQNGLKANIDDDGYLTIDTNGVIHEVAAKKHGKIDEKPEPARDEKPKEDEPEGHGGEESDSAEEESGQDQTHHTTSCDVSLRQWLILPSGQIVLPGTYTPLRSSSLESDAINHEEDLDIVEDVAQEHQPPAASHGSEAPEPQAKNAVSGVEPAILNYLTEDEYDDLPPTKRGTSWDYANYTTLFQIIWSKRRQEIWHRAKPLKGDGFWAHCARRLASASRAANPSIPIEDIKRLCSCKNFWDRYGRDLSGFNEIVSSQAKNPRDPVKSKKAAVTGVKRKRRQDAGMSRESKKARIAS